MDGGYYKAFQKLLSRPIPPIFNKIFSQSEKQCRAGSFKKRSIHRECAGLSLPARGLHGRAIEMCQDHEGRGFQRREGSAGGGANAFGKVLAMMAIKKRPESWRIPLRALRHIDAQRL